MMMSSDFGTTILLGYSLLAFVILSPLIISIVYLIKSIKVKNKKSNLSIPIASAIVSSIHMYVFTYIFLKYQEIDFIISYFLLIFLIVMSWYLTGKRRLLKNINRSLLILFTILGLILVLLPMIKAQIFQAEIDERTAIKRQALAKMEIQFYWPQQSSKYLYAERYSEDQKTYLKLNTGAVVGDMYMFNEKYYPRTQPCVPYPGPYNKTPDVMKYKPCMYIADINGFNIYRLDFIDGHAAYRFAKKGTTSLIFESNWHASDSDIEAYVAALEHVSVEVMADKVNY